MSPAAARWWLRLRAGFVAFHLTAVCVLALPSPGPGMRRAAWRDPTVQGEFRTWARTLRGLGFDVDAARLEQILWGLARRWVAIKGAMIRPVRPYADGLTGHQPWRMFVAPHRFPARLEIDLREGDTWRPIYIARDPDHAWRARQLDHDRVRAAIFRYGWPSYERAYGDFARWLARQAARDFPAGQALRVRMFKTRTLGPAEVRAGKVAGGRYIHERVFDLGAVRAERAARGGRGE